MPDQNIKIESANTAAGTQEDAQVFKSCIGWPKVSNTINQSSYQNKILETAQSPKSPLAERMSDLCASVCIRVHPCVSYLREAFKKKKTKKVKNFNFGGEFGIKIIKILTF